MQVGQLPFPRVTAFMRKPEGYEQVQRVHTDRVWPLKAEDDSEPTFLCLRRNYGERLAAFNSKGELLWEHEEGSCAHTQNIQVCPQTKTVYSFGYSHIAPLDLKTGQSKGFGQGPHSSNHSFANQDGHLIQLNERTIWVHDEHMRLLSQTKFPFAYSRADHDARSRLITLQGENYKKDGEFRHYVVSESGQLMFDEEKLTVHPGLSDAQGRLFQVIADPKAEQFEVLRLDPREVRRFPVDPGVVAAFPAQDGAFGTLNLGGEVPCIELRDAEGKLVSKADLPDKGLAGITPTRNGVLLTFVGEDNQATRVLAFNGELQEVYGGPDPALTAALPDGSFVVAHKDGVQHFSERGVQRFQDPWKAAEALGPLESYHLDLPIVHMRGRRGWADLWEDAQRRLGFKPPADVPVRLHNGALEIVRPVSEEDVRTSLGLTEGEWLTWNTPLSQVEQRQAQQHVISEKVFHDREVHGGLDPEMWHSAKVFAGYRDQPSAVTEGQMGRHKLLCLGTQGGQVSLVNLSPQGAQTRDQLPGPIVRTELQNRGMLAMDEQGNFMLIEPHTWKGGELQQVETFNPRATPPSLNSKSLEITDQGVQIGAVRVRRREP